jgi:hypothetical protein
VKEIVASTGPLAVAEAGAASIRGGGNAVDAVTAAALAWPPGLGAGGALVAAGTGIGRVCCRFPARVPGLGLSRPRRASLFAGGSPTALAAVPSVGPAHAAAVARGGRTGWKSAVAAAAAATARQPHGEALEALREAGGTAAVKGAWSLAAARALGPLSGGLLTRRDLIEAKPDLAEAELVAAHAVSWSLPATPAEPGPGPEPGRRIAVIALDRHGTVAGLVLDAGPEVAGVPDVLGVPANTLLAGQARSTVRRVGRPLPLLMGAAVAVDGALPTACGPWRALCELLSSDPLEQALERTSDELLVLSPGSPPRVWGARSRVGP